MYSKKLLSVSLHRLYGMDMRSHNSGNFRVKICIFERSNEKNYFSKTKIIFLQKNYTTIIRTYWATKYKSRSENKFG